MPTEPRREQPAAAAPGTGPPPSEAASGAPNGSTAAAAPRSTTPLQWIGLGMVFLSPVTAYFPAHPHPAWRHYDALPDPIGWILILIGVWALHRRGFGFDTVRWVGVLALLVSIPASVPQLTHQFSVSGQWGMETPQAVFCFMLAREIGVIGSLATPRDTYVAKRFGLLSWGFAIAIALPPLDFGGGAQRLDSFLTPVNLLVDLAFIFYLFVVNRREILGGPGPRDYSELVAAVSRDRAERAERPSRPSRPKRER